VDADTTVRRLYEGSTSLPQMLSKCHGGREKMHATVFLHSPDHRRGSVRSNNTKRSRVTCPHHLHALCYPSGATTMVEVTLHEAANSPNGYVPAAWQRKWYEHGALR
jgi:hypothetical protein